MRARRAFRHRRKLGLFGNSRQRSVGREGARLQRRVTRGADDLLILVLTLLTCVEDAGQVRYTCSAYSPLNDTNSDW